MPVKRYGTCPICARNLQLRLDGTLRHHLGDVYDGRWRQVCDGVGQPPTTDKES